MVVLAHSFRVKVCGEVSVKFGLCFSGSAQLEDLFVLWASEHMAIVVVLG